MNSSLFSMLATDLGLMAIDATPITVSSITSQNFLWAKLLSVFCNAILNSRIF